MASVEIKTGQTSPQQWLMGYYVVLMLNTLALGIPYRYFGDTFLYLLPVLILLSFVIRYGKDQNSLVYTHCGYVIGTFFRGLLLALVTFALSVLFLLILLFSGNLDMEAFQPCLHDAGGLRPCVPIFIKSNDFALKTGTLIVILPVIAYFLYRFLRGFMSCKNAQLPPTKLR